MWAFFVLDLCHYQLLLNDDAKLHVLQHKTGTFNVKYYFGQLFLTNLINNFSELCIEITAK